MTELRDARFQEALAHAPDAHMAPDARTRLAIQRMAAQAVQPAPAALDAAAPRAWWRRWLPGTGQGRMPWNAALATVLVASFVTVLWQGQPVPDAQLDDMPAAKKSARDAATRAPAPTAPVEPQPQPAPPVAAQKPTAAPAAPERPVPAGGRGAAMEAERSKAAAKHEAPEVAQARARREQPAAPAAAPAPAAIPPQPFPASPPLTAALPPPPPPAPAAAAPSPPMAAAAPRAQSAPLAEQAQRADAASADAAPAAAPPSRAAGLAAGSAFNRAAPLMAPDSPAIDGWDGLRVIQGGQTWRLARADALALAAQVRRLAPTTGGEALPGALSLRIELMQGDTVLAALELGDAPWVRWTLLRPAFAGRWTGQADRGQLQQLQLELQRLGIAPR